MCVSIVRLREKIKRGMIRAHVPHEEVPGA